ncbi:MAG: hypothetical protein DRP87_04260 [Spirochaetes bacterium]|nr:MAG: hypothetical protein DRP87_04260 [Spirochaetota bacterium]
MITTRTKAITVIFIINIALELSIVAAMVAGPTFQRLFSLSKTELGICLGATSVGMALFAPLVGHYTHNYGPSRMLIAGLVGAIIGVLLVSASSGLTLLLTGLIVTGIFGAFIANANDTITAELYPEQLRKIMALASGLWFSSSAISAPIMGTWLEISHNRGWSFWSFRVLFLTISLLFGICLLLTVTMILKKVEMNISLKEHSERRSGSNVKSRDSERGWFWIPILGLFHGVFITVLFAWINPMVQSRFAANEIQGSIVVGVVSFGIGFGRFCLWRFKIEKDDRLVLSLSGLLGAGLLILGLLSPTFLLTTITLCIASFFCSATFPCLLTMVGTRFPGSKAKVYGYLNASVASAGLLGPALVGILADAGLPLWVAIGLSPLAGLTLAALSFIWKITSP